MSDVIVSADEQVSEQEHEQEEICREKRRVNAMNDVMKISLLTPTGTPELKMNVESDIDSYASDGSQRTKAERKPKLEHIDEDGEDILSFCDSQNDCAVW